MSQPAILQLGAQGSDVQRLQGDLSRLGYTTQITGVFDENTDNAVKKFQADHNLTVDGVVGPPNRQTIRSGFGINQIGVAESGDEI